SGGACPPSSQPTDPAAPLPRHLSGEQRRVTQARQLHQPDTITESPPCLPRRLHRQARLPDPARPAQGNQPCATQRLTDEGELRPPPDEPAQPAAKLAYRRASPCHCATTLKRARQARNIWSGPLQAAHPQPATANLSGLSGGGPVATEDT